MTTSVALCTYNGENFIREQLDSILNQNFPINEIVICDDCSTDSTQKILKEYQEKFPQIFKIFFNESNIGYVKNFEKAISICKNEIIFLSDQDDVWFPEKAEKVIQYLSQNPETLVCSHNLYLLHSNQIPPKNYWELMKFQKTESNTVLLKEILISGNIFPGMSMAIRKDAKKWLPLKKLNTLLIHDFEFVILALHENRFGILDQVLAHYRLHENQNIGFGLRKTPENLTEKDVYNYYLGIQNTSEIVTQFGLNQEIIVEHKKYFSKILDLYLSQFGFLNRIFKKLKIKYYYKLLV